MPTGNGPAPMLDKPMLAVRVKLKLIVRLLVLFTILMSFVLLWTGCDGGLRMEGATYEWVNAPAGATSKIFIASVRSSPELEPALRSLLSNIPPGWSLVPLQDVEIAVGNKRTIEAKGEDGYVRKVTSGSGGELTKSWLMEPGKYEILVKARKTGYLEVVREAKQGDPSRHAVVAILVKSSVQSQ